MFTWQFSEVCKKPVTFDLHISYAELVQERFDIVSIDDISVSGEVFFDGKRGKMKLNISVDAVLLAANTARRLSFSESINVEEVLSADMIECIDVEKEEVSLLLYINSMIDFLIPLYVQDEEENEKLQLSGTHWKMMDEVQYEQINSEEKQEKKFSQLSALIAKK